MSAAESERVFDPDVVRTVDAFVASADPETVERELRARYGDPDVDHGRQQEALAYLRREYEVGEL